MTPVTALGGKPQRTKPPAACTTSTQVREHALWAAMEVRAITDTEIPALLAISARSDDPIIREHVRRLVDLALVRAEQCKRTGGFLDRCVEVLERAETARDWDGLADLTRLPAKDVAKLVRPLLTILRDPARLGERAMALGKLYPYFEQIGPALLEGIYAYELGKKNLATLDAEYTRWCEFGAAS